MGKHMNRRHFVGASLAALGVGAAGCMSSGKSPRGGARPGPLERDIQALVNRTPFVDTHEHLMPEAERVAMAANPEARPATDFSLLFRQYSDADLRVAGMPEGDFKRFISPETPLGEKWGLVAPYYDRCRNTGFLQCVRETVRALYGEDDVREDNFGEISRRLREDVRPGFYHRILREEANIEYAHVCREIPPDCTPQHGLLVEDICIPELSSAVKMPVLNRRAGAEVATLAQAHAVIDRIFETAGPRAIALKDQSAYWRGIDYAEVADAEAAPLFERFARGDGSLTGAEVKAVQDNLFRRCVRLATDCRLPVKLHTGYHANHSTMDPAVVRDNMADAARLAREFPGTSFVLMHIAYPCQNELIALCKHYPNIYADMCWAWIIDPAGSARFMREFLAAAPACKLFAFGGDFVPVELVAGHARMARRGIAGALAGAVAEGWIPESDIPALVERIMRGNAHELYDLDRVMREQPAC